jgi:hypothetical protein
MEPEVCIVQGRIPPCRSVRGGSRVEEEKKKRVGHAILSLPAAGALVAWLTG